MYPHSTYSSSSQHTSPYYTSSQAKAPADHDHGLGRPASMPSLYHNFDSSPSGGTGAWQPPHPLPPPPQPGEYYGVNSEPNSLLSSPTPSSPPANATSSSMLQPAYNAQHYFVPQTTTHHHHYGLSYVSHPHHSQHHGLVPRSKLTTTLWEDENTVCYQVDAKGICVARRHDNDMINGTKLLNVAGMSRGKRDGILKNEKGRVVVKVGAMHLKGVWITFARAKALAAQHKIQDTLFPLFVDDPSAFLYSPSIQPPMTGTSRFGGSIATGHHPTSSSSLSWDRGAAVDPSSSSSSSQSFRSSGMTLNHDDVYASHSAIDYRPRVGGLVGSSGSFAYPSQPQPQQKQPQPHGLPSAQRNLYFADHSKHDDAGRHESTASGATTTDGYSRELGSSKENGNANSTLMAAGRDSTDSVSPTSLRRGSLVMNVPGRVTSPRHHPYTKPFALHQAQSPSQQQPPVPHMHRTQPDADSSDASASQTNNAGDTDHASGSVNMSSSTSGW